MRYSARKVLGAERRRRWSYDEKVRLVEETLQAEETVCGVARHGGSHGPPVNSREGLRRKVLELAAVVVDPPAGRPAAEVVKPE
jgi:transposase-like protein